jgi:hypothetical protein
MPSVGIIDEVNFAISHQIIWRYRLFFVSLHPKHQEQYPERVTRQPGSWKTTVVKVRCGRNIYKLQKTFQVMQQHIYYTKYALQFADMQIPELVNIFNSQVQNRGWSSMRAYHDQALIDEFQYRGIDITAVSDGKTTSFAHSVRYDLPDNKLIAIG